MISAITGEDSSGAIDLKVYWLKIVRPWSTVLSM